MWVYSHKMLLWERKSTLYLSLANRTKFKLHQLWLQCHTRHVVCECFPQWFQCFIPASGRCFSDSYFLLSRISCFELTPALRSLISRLQAWPNPTPGSFTLMQHQPLSVSLPEQNIKAVWLLKVFIYYFIQKDEHSYLTGKLVTELYHFCSENEVNTSIKCALQGCLYVPVMTKSI